MDTWLLRMCRQSCVRQLSAWGLIVLAAVFVAALNARYISNFLSGPFMVTAEELQRISDPETTHHYFVRVTGSKALDTGLQQLTVTTRHGREVSRYASAAYYGLLVGDRLLLVKGSQGLPTIVEGALEKMTPELRSRLFSGPEGEQLESVFYPFYLETEGFRNPGYWGIGISAVLFFLLLKYARPPWIRFKDLSKHPVIKRVQSWGDPVSVSAEIQQDYLQYVRVKHSGVSLTDKYVIINSFFTFDVLRFDDLLWGYKRVTRHYTNFIPTGKTHNAVLIFYGGAADITAKEKQVDEMLMYAATKAPWAVFGYSKELQELFSKHTQEFCAGIEARRHQAAGRS